MKHIFIFPKRRRHPQKEKFQNSSDEASEVHDRKALCCERASEKKCISSQFTEQDKERNRSATFEGVSGAAPLVGKRKRRHQNYRFYLFGRASMLFFQSRPEFS